MEITNICNDVHTAIDQFLQKYPNGIPIIRGATATGKSKLSILLAKYFDTEIISADSRQIFKYMNIGTDKVTKEIRDRIPHHQIDIINPDQSYTAGQWKNDVEKQVKDIQNRGKIPMVVGGTGLYIDTIYKNFSMPDVPGDDRRRATMFAQEEKQPGTLHKKLQEIDPIEAQKLHPNSTRYIVRALEIYEKTGKRKSDTFVQQPVKWPLLMIGLWRDKEDTNKRINARIKEMLHGGLVDEVQRLLDQGYNPDLQSMQGIGYKETVEYLQGKYNKNKLEENLKRTTHYLAKKQRTRFRRYIAEGKASPKDNVVYKVYAL